ncbi:putative membrane protein [Leptospira inadai serovar Lyme str. 10]|uniref:Dolichyl-phosphate-mannose-protein mannosyltransferase n=2 Tax=Leptospira inadai serovar Lyme TaxID=293084 RepID=A0ABX4YNZ9_9LEPT|nr:putative membrane protein [Leptospira inadai serovar Lyme str. 10]PNV76875.1 dolichyl-phosphate-mannose-protein mannosyltransferase [Leptospira inadai serovar Lyme]
MKSRIPFDIFSGDRVTVQFLQKLFSKIITLFLFSIIVTALFRFLNSEQSNIINASIQAMSVDPPLVTKWIYRDSFYFLLGYGVWISLILVTLKFLSKFNLLFDDKIVTTALVLISISMALMLRDIPDVFYDSRKRNVIIAFLVIFSIALVFKGSFIQELSRRVARILNEKYAILVGLIVLLGLLQRLLALQFDDGLLQSGDDPKTFYESAINLYENGIRPNLGFSPGMSYFLFACFKIFEIGQLIPKILLALIGMLGLFCSIETARIFIKSKFAGIAAGVFYLTSSHYVSFSNQLWNENLFNPLFSIFIYINLVALRKSGIKYIILQILITVFAGICFSLLRSWFPLVFLVFLAGYCFESRNGNILRKAQLILIALLFCFSYLSPRFLGGQDDGLIATNNSQVNFVIGNNPYSQGTYTRHWVTFVAESKLDVNSKEMANYLVQIYKKNPELVFTNLYKKLMLWFVGAGGPRPLGNYYQHPLLISQYFYRISISLLLLVGLIRLIKYKKFILPSAYLSILLVHLVFFVDYRFTLTAMPIQAVLVPFGIIVMANIIKKKIAT